MENCDAQQIAEEIGMYKGWKQYVTVLSSLDNPEIIKKAGGNRKQCSEKLHQGCRQIIEYC
jgi:hypothetical protein